MGKQSRKKRGRPAPESALSGASGRPADRTAGQVLLHVLIIAAVAITVYSNTFSSPFVFDDEPVIVNNSQIRALSPEGNAAAPGLWEKSVRSRSIGYLTFALNYRWGGLRVNGYHGANLLIHAANSLLVYWIALQLAGFTSLASSSRWFALFSGLLFVAHPLQTQAVTYIVQRFASLVAFFSLLSLALYLKARVMMQSPSATGDLLSKRRPLLLLALSLISVLCAMQTKETSFSLPVLIGLSELMFFSARARQRIVLLAPYAATMMVIPLMFSRQGPATLGTIGDVAKAAAAHEITRLEYLATQPRVLVTYLRLFLFPVNQNLDYDYPAASGLASSAAVLPALLLAAFAAAGAALVLRSRRKEASGLRIAAYGIFWFFIALSVESSLIPIRDVIFEHRMYLPAFGLVLAVMAAAGFTVEQAPGKARAVTVLLVIAIALFAAATFKRNAVWQNKVSIWEDVVSKSPGKVSPHTDLGVEYEKLGRLDDAMREYRTASRLNRKAKAAFAVPHYNLGSIYYRKDMLEEAIPELLTALELNPGYAEAHNNLGSVYFRQGHVDRAVQEFQTAARINPRYSEALHNLGSSFLKQNRPDDAVRSYQAALQAGSNAPETHYGLGAAFTMKGKWDEAAAEFRLALRLNPKYAEAERMLENIRKQQGMK